MSYEYIYEAVHEASPVPKLAAALEDDVEAAGIVTPQDPDALVGSRLFNVASAAMDALRVDPEAPVVGKPLEIPKPEDWLARFTIRLIDDSVKRPYTSKPDLRSDTMPKLATSPTEEADFLRAVSLETVTQEIETIGKIFIDKEGIPILFKKHVGQPTTLNFKPIQINKVTYPAGTLLAMQESPGHNLAKNDRFNVARFDPNDIAGAAALRFSALSFRPEDRPRALLLGNQPDTARLTDSIMAHTIISHLVERMPDRKLLRLTYQGLRLPGI